MNNLIIDGMIRWKTNETSVEVAISELFNAIIKSGLPLDIAITDSSSLLDEDGIEID